MTVKIIENLKKKVEDLKCDRCTRLFLKVELNENHVCNECAEEIKVFEEKNNCDHCSSPIIYRSTFCMSCYTHDIRVNKKNLELFLQKRVEERVATRRLVIFLMGLFFGIFAIILIGWFIFLLIIFLVLIILNQKFLHYEKITKFLLVVINNTIGGRIFREGGLMREDD